MRHSVVIFMGTPPFILQLNPVRAHAVRGNPRLPRVDLAVLHGRMDEMRHRQFGSTKREVAIIGQGTWYGRGDNRESAIKALRRGLDLGMTHIDTAEIYLSGRAEEWVAEAILHRREEVFLVSKVLPHNASRKGTVIACERSLGRLKTDRLDC